MINGSGVLCNMCYQSTDQVSVAVAIYFEWNSRSNCAKRRVVLFRHPAPDWASFSPGKLNLLMAQMKTKPFRSSLHVNIACCVSYIFFKKKKLIHSCFRKHCLLLVGRVEPPVHSQHRRLRNIFHRDILPNLLNKIHFFYFSLIFLFVL